MGRYNQRAIRQRILERRGLTGTGEPSGPRLKRVGQTTELDRYLKRRSATVRFVEEVYGKPISDILSSHTDVGISRETGVSRATIWRWRNLLTDAQAKGTTGVSELEA